MCHFQDVYNASMQEYAESYLRTLEEGGSGRFQHTIWPEHCLVGTDVGVKDSQSMVAQKDINRA